MAPASLVDGLYEVVDFGRRQETRIAACIGAHIDHPDAVVRVQDSDRIARTDGKPSSQRTGIAAKKRMQHQRRQCKIVYPIDLAGDFDLLQIMAVNLDQDLDAQRTGLCGQLGDKVEGFRDHETAGSGLFDRIPDGIEPYHLYARSLKLPEDRIQISFRLRVADIDIHLLRIECSPQQFPSRPSAA